VTESVEGRSGAGVLARSEAAGLSPSLADAMASGSKSLRSLLKGVRSEAERNAIAMALEKTGGNRKAAARLLKVSYRTVLYKIEEYKMIPPATSQSGKLDAAQNPTRDGSESTRSVGPAGKRLVDGRKELR
jgi:DNA-binding NtrC family response regulator